MKMIKESNSEKIWAQTNEEFLFKFLDLPVIPKQRSAPNRTLIVLIGTSAGFLFSIFLILGIELFREHKGSVNA